MPFKQPDYWEKSVSFTNKSAALNFQAGLEASGYRAMLREDEKGVFTVLSMRGIKIAHKRWGK